MPTADIHSSTSTPLGGLPTPTIDSKPPVVVVKKGVSLPKLPSLNSIRRGYEALDFDGLRDDHGGNRTWATANNGIGALLATGNCIPGISLFTGAATLLFGAGKFVTALIQAGEYHRSDIAKGLMASAMKDVVKGGSVFLLPGVAEAINAVSAAKDYGDTFAASLGKPRA